jgi:hypothetical protein
LPGLEIAPSFDSVKKFFAYACLIFGLFFRSAVADTVWVPPKGLFHATFSLTGSQWDQFMQNGTSPVELPGDITQYEIAANLEYTFLTNFSVDLLFPIVISQKKFVYLQTDEFGQILDVGIGPDGQVRDVSTNAGLGDVTLGSKYIFLEKPLSLGARAWLKIPGTYSYGEVVNAPGDGQLDVGLALLAGAAIPQARMYVRSSLGLVLRAGEPSNQIEFMFEPGVNVTDSVALRLIYQHIEQLGGEDILVYNQLNFYPAVEEDSDRLNFGVSYRANETVSFFANYAQTIAGNNTANMKGVTFGMDFTF